MRENQLPERLVSCAAHGQELARRPELAMIRRRARRRCGGRVLAVVVVGLVTPAGVQAIRIHAARELPALRPLVPVSSFVAVDRQGRLVVASADTGKLLRVLAPPRSDQTAGVGPLYRPVVPGDHSVVYDAGACAGTGPGGRSTASRRGVAARPGSPTAPGLAHPLRQRLHPGLRRRPLRRPPPTRAGHGPRPAARDRRPPTVDQPGPWTALSRSVASRSG